MTKPFLIFAACALALVAVGCQSKSPTEDKVPDEYSIIFELLDASNSTPVVGEDIIGTSPDGYETEHVKSLAPDGRAAPTPIKNNGPIDLLHETVQVRTGGLLTGYVRYLGPVHRLIDVPENGRHRYVATIYLTRQ